jgi:hypothetical protein
MDSMTETSRDRIKAEIGDIAKKHQILHAEDVVEFARKHKASELHKHFEWNNDEAAEKYRLDQARALIRVCVVIETRIATPIRCMVSLSTDRKNGGGYRTIESVLSNDKLHRQMLADALMELKRTQMRYQALNELRPVFDAIEQVSAQTNIKEAA